MILTNRKILIVDDTLEILDMIKESLTIAGFENILTAKNQTEALALLDSEQIELAVLDIMLPDGSGFEILRYIRQTSQLPVLFLSAISDIEKQYQGFELGADDYLVKPFRPKELELRIRSILRRAYPEELTTLQLSHCIIDFERALVLRENKEISLTAKEYNLLKLLTDNANKILSFEQILSRVWGENFQGYENTLMAHIRKIRQKIEENPSQPQHLLTVKGLGYQLRTHL
ncbi:response regulator transcription factor [Streptococcus sp. 20-1249]|uniref:response regulator transcription factor n=1 Tax=Streptococcus hepaticus TaxID=3349163 RepID=UPI003747C99D